MTTLLKLEFYKLIKKSRTYLSFILLLILLSLLFTGLKLEGQNIIDFILSSLTRQFSLEGNVLNGYFVAFLALGSLYIHIPILLVIVTGDLLSSELENGTARLFLSRPIKRSHWLLSKHIVAFVYVLVFILFTAFAVLLPAVILFGKGDIIVLFKGFEVIEQSDFMMRYIAAILYSALGMGAFGVFSVALSSFVKRSLSTILITLGILIISTLLQNFAPGVFESWQPFLFTYHISQWQLFFFSEIPYDEIFQSTIWLIGFMLVSILASLYKFNKMNILE